MTEVERLENLNDEKILISEEEIERLKKRDVIIKNLQQDYEKMLNIYKETFKSIEQQYEKHLENYQKLLADKDKEITKKEEEIDFLRDRIDKLNKEYMSVLLQNIASQNNQKHEHDN